jgi:hypothetical protein
MSRGNDSNVFDAMGLFERCEGQRALSAKAMCEYAKFHLSWIPSASTTTNTFTREKRLREKNNTIPLLFWAAIKWNFCPRTSGVRNVTCNSYSGCVTKPQLLAVSLDAAQMVHAYLSSVWQVKKYKKMRCFGFVTEEGQLLGYDFAFMISRLWAAAIPSQSPHV